MGRYEDLCVRQGAVWKLKRRELSGAAKDLPVEK
jgi:hypothetical protein